MSLNERPLVSHESLTKVGTMCTRDRAASEGGIQDWMLTGSEG